MNQPEPSNASLNVYRAVAAVGVLLMGIGVVGGVFVKGLSELDVVGTTVPGIFLLLFAIRGLYKDDV